MIEQEIARRTLIAADWNISKAAKVLCISRPELYRCIKTYNIVRPSRFNEHYFNIIDCDDKAYFLGYLMADGCVCTSINRLDFGIHKKDISILHEFKIKLNSQNLVREYTKVAVINHTSKTLISDLAKHGCTNKKSLTLQFPTTIPDNYIWSFIRGYFDGDGCVTSHMPNTNKDRIRINFVGTKEFLTSLQILFNTSYKLRTTGTYKRNYVLEITSKKNIEYIVSHMYKNATIKLERKYNLCKSYIQGYV